MFSRSGPGRVPGAPHGAASGFPYPDGGWAGQLASAFASLFRPLFGARLQASLPALSLEARLPLGGTRAVLLVGCCGRRYLLGASAESLFLIGEVSAAAECAESTAEAQT